MKNLILIFLSVLLSGITTAQQFPVKKLNGIPHIRVVPAGVTVKAVGVDRISLPYQKADGNLYYMDNATERQFTTNRDQGAQWDVNNQPYTIGDVVVARTLQDNYPEPRVWQLEVVQPATAVFEHRDRFNTVLYWQDLGEVKPADDDKIVHISDGSSYDWTLEPLTSGRVLTLYVSGTDATFIGNTTGNQIWDGANFVATGQNTTLTAGQIYMISTPSNQVNTILIRNITDGAVDINDIQTTIRPTGIAEDTKIASELAIRTELDLKMAIADLVTAIRATGVAEDSKYVTEKSVRDAIEALNFAGLYKGSSVTFAGLPVGANGDWAVLNAEDGANQAGIYVTDGATYTFVKGIPDIIVLLDADAQDIASTVTGTLSGKLLYDREQALQSTLPNFQPTDADNAIAKSHSPRTLTQWAESARAFHDAANPIFDANSLLLTNPARLISIDPTANTLSNMPESHTEGIRAFITVQGNGVNGGPSTAGQAFMFVTEHDSPTAIGIFHRTLTGSTWSTWTRQTEDMWIETDANVGTLAVPLGNKVVLADGKDISLTVLVSTKVEPVRVVPRTDWGNCNQIQVSDAGWSIQPQPTKGTQELLYIPNHTTQTWEAKEVDNEFVKSGTTAEKVALGIVPSSTGFFDTDLGVLQHYKTSSDVFTVNKAATDLPYLVEWASANSVFSAMQFKITTSATETTDNSTINLPNGQDVLLYIIGRQFFNGTQAANTLGGAFTVRNDNGVLTLVSIEPNRYWGPALDYTTTPYTDFPNLVNSPISISISDVNAIFNNIAGAGIWTNVAGSGGASTADTDALPEGATNLYYTEARVTANTDVAANTAKVGITPAQAAEITASTTHISDTEVHLPTANNPLEFVRRNASNDGWETSPITTINVAYPGNAGIPEVGKDNVYYLDETIGALPTPATSQEISVSVIQANSGDAQGVKDAGKARVTHYRSFDTGAGFIWIESEGSAEEDIVITQQVIGTALVEERGIFKEIHDDVTAASTGTVTFPDGGFASPPKMQATAETNGHTINIRNVTATTFTYDQWDVEDIQQGGNFTYYAKGLK